ncbi:AraC family transcriptional regulator [Anaerostipes sp.]|uniref:AraC family transcriptional regulator n=1 Tax=Anaerostipes sp. TaxID=1872530 RepID=UPI0025BB16CE|nr:AraC family transcriptional regulator [Anaerostipes sp.]
MKHFSPLEKAVRYIEEHLNEDIGLSDVSRETGYSYYHMTRLFSSVLGEPAGRYINRRRLYKASESLLHSEKKIMDIALDCGFESSEAFSRAFKSAFGRSPLDYRKAGLNLVVQAKRALSPKDICHVANNISHTPEVCMLEETKVAGLRGITSISDNRLPGLWEQYLCLHQELFAASGTGYCICETSQTTYTKEGDTEFSVLVGSPVSNFKNLPQTLEQKILSPGKYAVFTHRGSLSKLLISYQYIYGTWLPSAKEELDSRDDFELYERKVCSVDDPDNEVKIFIAIK